MSGLTPKQEKFCQLYQRTGNASEAYRGAYDAGAMKPISITRMAHDVLHHPKVAARVKELQAQALKRHEVTIDRVLEEFARIAFLDIRKAFNEDGTLKGLHEMDDATAAAITAFEIEDLWDGKGDKREKIGRVRKVKLSDKKGALDSLARYLKMFTDSVELTGPNGGPIETKDLSVLEVARRMAFVLRAAAEKSKGKPKA